jgi:hypothetical protein
MYNAVNIAFAKNRQDIRKTSDKICKPKTKHVSVGIGMEQTTEIQTIISGAKVLQSRRIMAT